MTAPSCLNVSVHQQCGPVSRLPRPAPRDARLLVPHGCKQSRNTTQAVTLHQAIQSTPATRAACHQVSCQAQPNPPVSQTLRPAARLRLLPSRTRGLASLTEPNPRPVFSRRPTWWTVLSRAASPRVSTMTITSVPAQSQSASRPQSPSLPQLLIFEPQVSQSRPPVSQSPASLRARPGPSPHTPPTPCAQLAAVRRESIRVTAHLGWGAPTRSRQSESP